MDLLVKTELYLRHRVCHRGAGAAGGCRRDMKYLKIHGLVTTCCKEAVIYLGRDSVRGRFANVKELMGTSGTCLLLK